MADVFINYRTGDEEIVAGLLHQALTSRFGPEAVFLAGRSIAPGDDYRQALLDGARSCRALLAVIGPHWLDRAANGERKIDRPDDWVKREIVEAFRHNVRVIPVLIGAKDRLAVEDLPPELEVLAFCQSLRLQLRSLQEDLGRLGAELIELVPGLKELEQTAAGEDGHGAGNTVHATAHHSTVGVQGVNYGNVHYGDVRYEVSADDTPARKFEVARNCLDGDMPRRAEELIRDIYQLGFVSASQPGHLANQVAYHWTISVLSDRSFELLGAEQFADIKRAATLVQNGPRDEWRQAHDVVVQLVEILYEQEQSGSPNAARLDSFFAEFDLLPDIRREDIRRHLDMILAGAIQDRFDARFSEVVRTQRTADGREARVWKFFEPVPHPPRRMTVPKPSLGLFPRIMAICGAVLALTGLALALVLTGMENGKTMAISLLLMVVGFAIIVAAGPSLFPARYSAFRPESEEQDHEERDHEEQDPQEPAPQEFQNHIQDTVRREFDRRAPKYALQRSTWTVATQRFRSTLAKEMIDLYGDQKVEPGAVDWLITWYARETAAKWADGDFRESQHVSKAVALVVGAILMFAGWWQALPLMTLTQGRITGVALFWLLCGCALLGAAKADVYVVALLTRSRDQATARRRNESERAAYVKRRADLADRPDDATMVRWLDYDKIYLKTLARNQYGLSNRDIIAHAILTEAAPNCRRARVKNGPPRFSAYTVWVFLLTVFGVRQVRIHLDFPTGIVQDQQRTTFRYDAITSARVTEIGFRFDDGHREVLLPQNGQQNGQQSGQENRQENGEARTRTDSSEFVFYQMFRLSLDNGQYMDITVENLDAWLLKLLHDDKEAAQEWAPDNSDLAGALRILEAVAAEGKEWIVQAKARRLQRLIPTGPRSGPGSGPGPDSGTGLERNF